MAQSTSDFMKEQDKKIAEDMPWLPEFNYTDTITPENILDKIKKATHKINIKSALESITSNSTSKLNSKSQENSQGVVADSSLHAEEIVTKESQPEINTDEISKD